MNILRKYGIALALALLAAASILGSCAREPIQRPLKDVQIQFRIDLSLNDSTQWVKPDTLGPSLIKVNFYNPQTGRMEGTMYTTKKGGNVTGVTAGTYDIVVFSDDAQYTRIVGEEDFNTLLANTDKVKSKVKAKAKADGDDDGGVDESVAIMMPDHLFVGRAMGVVIPEMMEKDTALVIPMDMKTIIESYKIEIDGIKGLENVNTADLYLAGHASGRYLGPDRLSEEIAILHVPCYVALADSLVKATCTTFGKIMTAESLAKLHLVLSGADGSVYDLETDIKDQYLRPDHILKFHLDADIKSRESSTFQPEVEEWDTEHTQIEIQ